MTNQQLIDVAKEFPGPILLLAGPGTGKTHQLARRVKFLIEEKGESPENITVITFTGEAAREMRKRLCDDKNKEVYVPPNKQPDHIRTMHSLGYKIINDTYRSCGLRKGFTVITDRIREIILSDSARILKLTVDEAKIADKCRRNGYCKETSDPKCLICKKYEKLLRGLNAVDYDDQIFLACKILKTTPELHHKWQQSTRHLLIDEYQDINPAQYEFIRLLCKDQENGVFVVGDDDQSIYSWRGGSPDFIVNFKNHFSNHQPKIYSLDECWRCPPNFLKAALGIVSRDNANRYPKSNLHSTKLGEQQKVIVSDVPSDKYEADMICSIIADSPMTEDVLILVPGHRFALPIKHEMRRRRIAYECKTSVADSGFNSINIILKWLRDEKDNYSLRLCLEDIISNREIKISFDKNLNSIEDKRESARIKIANLWEKVISEKSTLYKEIEGISNTESDIKCIQDFLVELKNQWNSRKTTSEFIGTVVKIIRPWTSINDLSEEIEDWVADAFAKNATTGETVTRILTMEAAKGIGADHVFIVGLNHGIFPPEGIPEKDLHEKQRLFYVSMTRAKKKLYLFSARTREGRFSFQPFTDGQEVRTLQPSKFLEWLPDDSVEREQKWPHK